MTLHRGDDGVMVIDAADELDLARGLGFAHAVDRGMQLLLTRLIGQGRLSELEASETNLGIDVFMRQMGFAADAEVEGTLVTGAVRDLLGAYRDGVEAGLAAAGVPLELRLMRYEPERWRAADTFTVMRLMTYVGLSQSQQDAEKLIVEAVIAGVDVEQLRALFAPHLDMLGAPLVDVIARVHLGMPLGGRPLDGRVPALRASNAWAVAPRLSASGSALAAGDPHLEINRLPAVWYECVARLPGDFRIGVTVPGLPIFVMGRSRRISATFTYGFMDLVDYFLEDVKGGAFLRGRERRPFDVRLEEVARRKGDPVRLAIFENHAGTLETPADEAAPKDGVHLLRAFAGRRAGPSSVAAVSALWRAADVREARRALHGCALSANWVLADESGGIAVQQTGSLPLRARSGLCPLPAWERDTLWRGFVPGSDLAYVEDPPEGYVVTANDDWNPPGGAVAVNLSMGSARAARIRELLSGRGELTLEDLKAMQRDVVSLHARAILGMVWPHLPETPAGDLLRAWDGRYDAGSKAAVLFERLYAGLKDEVFGKRMFGERLWAAIGDTVLTHEFFPIFDRVLLDGDEKLFFGKDGRAGVVGRVAARVAAEDPARVPAWGELNTITMTNVFFQGRLPRPLGFDAGPFPIEGGRASIVQGQVLTAAGRKTSFAPSWRYVTDMGTDQVETALPGGPSDRRFSRWYTSDLGRWRRYEYKTLRGRAR